MLKIYTMYNRAQRINENKVYDSHDDVDRLSYVDNAQLIRRFVQEGKNLAVARAQALRAGMYSGDLKEIYSEEGGLAVPVYQTDPVFFDQTVDRARTSVHNAMAGHEATSDNKSNVSVVPNPPAEHSDALASGGANAPK